MNSLLRRHLLSLIVFITGAAVLVIEVTATRILAPWFGNTIFTFSSVISVILAALSLGYYAGGRAADRFPSQAIFFAIIAISGVSIYSCQSLANFLLPDLGHKLSIAYGPLIVSLALFFIPGIFLGMLSPWAIRLQSDLNPDDGAGTTAGKIYFWSTLGSIIGSLGAGFVLIPHFSLSTIMFSTATLLVIIGLTGYLFNKGRPIPGIFIVITALAMGGISWTTQPRKEPGVLYEANGIYEHIKVQDVMYNNRPARLLFQDRTVSGLRYLDNGDTVDYTHYPPLINLLDKPVGRALAIGGGTYILPQSLVENFPDATIDVAEIEPSLFEIGQKYFDVISDDRLRNHIIDGRRFLADSQQKYDLIFTDVYYAMTIPSHFATLEYHTLIRDHLTSGGVYMANLVGDLNPAAPNIIYSQMRLIRETFPNCYFFATAGSETRETQSIVAFAINGESSLDINAALLKNSGSPLLQNLSRRAIDQSTITWSNYDVFTDDYAPVEYMSMAQLRRELSAN